MKPILIGLFVLVNFFFFGQIELSRDVMGTAGKAINASNMQMSYTVGEPFTATLQNNQMHTLGFQQADALPASELSFLVPGGLSPNGDDINDTWLLTGFENYPYATVKVFDRWGQEVFFSTSTMAPWDGTFDGKDLPTADYYYIIDLGDGQKYNGVVTLKK